MKIPAELSQDFCCPKCRARTAIIKDMTLPGTTFGLSFFGNTRYIALTCSLCGYTEFYDARVYAQTTEHLAAQETILEKN